MKKHRRKIGRQISLLLIAIVMIGGTLVFLTTRDLETSDDQLQLKQELQENAELLEKQGIQNEQTEQGTQANQDFTISVVPSILDNVTQEMPEENSLQFTAIGDSVMLGAAPALKELFPDSVINAAESRQVWDAEAIATELEEKGELMDKIVIALGTNGTFKKSSGQELLDYFGKERQIYWVAPYGKNLQWQDNVWEVLNELECDNDNLTILNWPKEAKQHSEWFYDDGIHLNSDGQNGYAQFLRDSLSNAKH